MTCTVHEPDIMLNLFSRRRSIRRYTRQPVPEALICSMLEAAIWAPSAHNRQPWRFCVVREAGHQAALAQAMGARLRRDLQRDGLPAEAIEADAARSYSRITGAAALIALCLSMRDMDSYPDAERSQREWVMAVQSTAMAGQNLLLAADALGLGACWMCAPLFCPDVVSDVLALPDDWQPQALITLGYPAEERTKTRHALETSVLWR
jgi:coenzyme F420-0:L-glutamate ligase/coenzyme F420-1:gamma-L-glutamate ligase